MHDIIADDPKLISECNLRGVEPLIIGKDVEFVNKAAKTSQALITIATSSKPEVLQSHVDAVTDTEKSSKEDFLHHRRSGQDQLSMRTLAERENVLIVNLKAYFEAQNQAQHLGRVLQNINIAEKKGVGVAFASFADTIEEMPTIHDMHAFWRANGASEEVIAASQETLKELIERSRLRASPEYVAEGVKKLQQQ